MDVDTTLSEGDTAHPVVEPPAGERRIRELQAYVSWAILAACVLVVFVSLQPNLLFQNTTPTGGDMGAHVWGPRFLADQLLPNFRLTGWTQDWYAGFPAYVFYMVVPSLFIVWLSAGPPLWLTPILLAMVAAVVWRSLDRFPQRWQRVLTWSVAAFVTVMCVPIPYNVAFKLVTVSGLLTLPLAAYALARASKAPFPVPALVAVATLPFIYDKGFTILGGNGASTMAGEFAFSIGLTFSLLYLAVLFRGVRTGRDRALGAALLALTILCHLIPAIFAGIATAIFIVVRREDRTPWWDKDVLRRTIAGAIVVIALGVLWLEQPWFPIVATVAVVALMVAFDVRAVKWLLYVAPVGILITGFWSVPFLSNSTYMNDMGWEKYTDYQDYLVAASSLSSGGMPHRNAVFALALLGIILSLVHRVRLGWFLTATVVVFAWTFRYFPQYRLWNARLLPFYYLGIYLLAGLALGLVIRSVVVLVADLLDLRARDAAATDAVEPSRDEVDAVEAVSVEADRGSGPVRRGQWIAAVVGATLAGVVTVVVLVAMLGALRILPGGQLVADPQNPGANVFRWAGIDFRTTAIVSDWARWNYSGLEGKPAYPEFAGIIDMMDQVSDEHGCGRAMWEYESDLNRFGTPMALMLLPYFTDSCVGSMEGLYFEASSTTPFHFLNQSELSTGPSSAQRDLPYSGFDIDQGVQHLQLMGVKYYMATTEPAIAAAEGNEDLTEVADQSFSFLDSNGTEVTNRWVVFEVAGADLVRGMTHTPIVVDDADGHIDGWVYSAEEAEPAEGQVRAPKTAGPATEWYLDPQRWQTPLSIDGPDDWPRASTQELADEVASGDVPTGTPVDEVEVSDIETTSDSISFHVDEIGQPVMVNVSYFPNWSASGAEGPWRVSPNFMVVIPTEKDVTLSYGYTAPDLVGWLSTIAGLAGLVGLGVLDHRRREQVLVAGHESHTPPDAESAADQPAEIVPEVT